MVTIESSNVLPIFEYPQETYYLYIEFNINLDILIPSA